MLRTRVLAALVFTPLLAATLWLGGWVLQLTCLVLSMLLLFEYVQLVLRPSAWSLQLTLYTLGLLHISSIYGWLPNAATASLPLLSVMLLLLVLLWQPEPLANTLQQAALGLLGIAWCAGLLPYLARLRALPLDGLGLAAIALLSTWSADTGAYFVGHRWGRRKLYPRISPTKTLEGAVGGVLSGMLAALLIHQALKLHMSLGWAVLLGASSALAGGVGDLCESLLKRSVGKKDSSHLIPGHGGLFDRFDGVLFGVGMVMCLRWWMG